MPDDRESPSAGWREVYDEMEADTDAEEATASCPDCDRRCPNVLRDVYECEKHGVFRANAGSQREQADSGEREQADSESEADADDAESPNADDAEGPGNRATGRAD